MEKIKEQILANLDFRENTFLFFLREGEFDKELYNNLIFNIHELNNTNINQELRMQIACYTKVI